MVPADAAGGTSTRSVACSSDVARAPSPPESWPAEALSRASEPSPTCECASSLTPGRPQPQALSQLWQRGQRIRPQGPSRPHPRPLSQPGRGENSLACMPVNLRSEPSPPLSRLGREEGEGGAAAGGGVRALHPHPPRHQLPQHRLEQRLQRGLACPLGQSPSVRAQERRGDPLLLTQ